MSNSNTNFESKYTLYFAYGSNLWLRQMNHRCPHSPYVGVAKLDGWKFIISQRHYANIVQSASDHVWGLLFNVTPADKIRLDRAEGGAYTQKHLEVTLFPEGRKVSSLVYVDETNTSDNVPWLEYVARLDNGVKDATAKGVPAEYFRTYFEKHLDLGKARKP